MQFFIWMSCTFCLQVDEPKQLKPRPKAKYDLPLPLREKRTTEIEPFSASFEERNDYHRIMQQREDLARKAAEEEMQVSRAHTV